MFDEHCRIFLLAAWFFFFSTTVAWSNVSCAVEPGFDCSKAVGAAEELICADSELAELDNLLTQSYQAALQSIPADKVHFLKAEQRGWIKGRNDCWKADDLRSCVKYAYQSRVVELQIMGGQLTVPEPVQYQCSGGRHDYLTAILYRQAIIPALVLTRVSDNRSGQVLLWPEPAGSGVKYRGSNVLFRGKGDEAMVDWQGEKLQCRILSPKQ